METDLPTVFAYCENQFFCIGVTQKCNSSTFCPCSATCSGTWIVLYILFYCETKIEHTVLII